jgi:hypothetical protein
LLLLLHLAVVEGRQWRLLVLRKCICCQQLPLLLLCRLTVPSDLLVLPLLVLLRSMQLLFLMLLPFLLVLLQLLLLLAVVQSCLHHHQALLQLLHLA